MKKRGPKPWHVSLPTNEDLRRLRKQDLVNFTDRLLRVVESFDDKTKPK